MKRSLLIGTISAALLVGCGGADEQVSAPVEAPKAEEHVSAPVEEPKVEIMEAEGEGVEAAGISITQNGAGVAAVVEKSTDESDTAFFASTQVEEMSVTVVSLDLENREVVLKREDGSEFTITPREDVKNLEQVSSGDIVNIKNIQQVSVQLVEGQNIPASATNMEIDRQAEDGEMPARIEAIKRVNVFTVKSIDLDTNVFVLENAEGGTKKFQAQNPKNLARASVDDSVVVTLTSATLGEVVKADK